MSWKGMDLVVRIVGDLKRYRADLREAGRDTQQAMGQAKAATDGLTAAQRGLEGQAGRVASSASRAGSSLAGLNVTTDQLARAFGGVSFAAGAVKFVTLADEATLLNNRLKLATGSVEAAAAAQTRLYEVAQSSRVSFTALGTTYAQMARATQEAGISTERLMTVTQAIGNAMAISGGSAGSMQAALIQLSQGLASGTLRGEELNSVMEQTPRLAQAIAEGMGVTIGQLRAMGMAGELTAQQVIKALESQAEVLRTEVTGATMTAGQAFTQLGNAAVMMVGKINESAGVTSSLADKVSATTRTLDVMGERMAETESKGGSRFMQVMNGIGTAVGRLTFDTLAFSAETLNYSINGLTGGVFNLSTNIDLMPENLRTMADQMSRTTIQVQEAEKEYAQLAARLARAPDNIYIKSELGNLARYIASLREAQTEQRKLMGMAAGGSGSSSVPSGDTALARAQRAEWDAMAPQRAEYLAAARTDTQKFNDEMAKARKAFGGMVPPEVEAALRAKFIKPVQAAGAALVNLRKDAAEVEAFFRQQELAADGRWDAEEKAAQKASDEVEAFFRQQEIDFDRRAQERADKEADAVKAAQDKLREDERKAWEKTWEQVSQSFTDALMEGGKSVAEYLKGLFRTLVLRPIIAPVGAALASMFGGPAAAGQGGSSLGSLSSLQNLLNPSKIFSSFGDSLAFAADSAGQWLVNNTSGYLNQLGGQLMGNAGTIGTIGSYAGGAMAGLGIGKAISGGYSAFGSSGNTAVNAGTIIGSIFGGPVGGAIGGTIGGVVNRLFGRKAPVTTSQGITGTFSADGANVQQYQDWFAKGGLFRSNKSGTNYSAVSSEMDSFLDAALAQVATTTRAYAELMSLNADALAGITQSVKINLQGMNAQQQEQEIAKALAGFGSRLAQDLLGTFETTVTKRRTFLGRKIETTVTNWVAGPFVRAGETAGEALARLGSALGLTNTLFDTLGTALFAASLQGADYASSLVDAFGGLENLQNATLAYYGAYYSEQERLATGTRQMGAAMQALGLSLPSSRDGFRALVEAQDLTTEAGRSTYAALMGLAPAFAELTQTMEQLGSTVGDEVRRLRGLLTTDSSTSLAALQAQFATSTAMARAGNADALARLPELSQAIEAAATLQARTAVDVALMRGQLAASLGETLGMLGLNVPAFEVGTNYVPRTMLAQIHEGEAIVPRAYNPAAGGTAPGSEALARRVEALVTELQGLRAEVRSGVNHSAKTARILDRVARDGDAFVTVAQA